jgi:hypothetical protein
MLALTLDPVNGARCIHQGSIANLNAWKAVNPSVDPSSGSGLGMVFNVGLVPAFQAGLLGANLARLAPYGPGPDGFYSVGR